MDFIETYRPIAEFVYFLSWPSAVIAAAIGIYQIKTFRKEAKVRFRRETISQTLEILDRKIKSLEDHVHKAGCVYDNLNHPELVYEIRAFTANDVTINSEWLEWYNKDSSRVFRNHIIDALNEFESLANYIFSGIVDEDLCYTLENYYILETFKMLEVHLALSIPDKATGPYANLVKLHTKWNHRSLHDKTTREHIKLSNTLATIPKPSNEKIITL